MSIETTFDPTINITSSYNILKEFITTYILTDEIDVTNEAPQVIEGFELSKPILYLEVMPGSKKKTGIGNKIGNGNKAEFKNLSYMAWWYVDNNCGGTNKSQNLGERLEYIFLHYGHELGQAGLKNWACSTYRDLPKASLSPVWGGRNMITFRCLITY
jgi:hypothetical protein